MACTSFNGNGREIAGVHVVDQPLLDGVLNAARYEDCIAAIRGGSTSLAKVSIQTAHARRLSGGRDEQGST